MGRSIGFCVTNLLFLHKHKIHLQKKKQSLLISPVLLKIVLVYRSFLLCFMQVRRLRIQQRLKSAELGILREEQENELPDFPSFIPFLPPLVCQSFGKLVCYRSYF